DPAERRVLPSQRQSAEARKERAGEAVSGPEPAIRAGLGEIQCALNNAVADRTGGSRRWIAPDRGENVEQAASISLRIGKSHATVLPVLLRRPDQERFDLIGVEVWAELEQKRGGTGHDGGRHGRPAEPDVRRAVRRRATAVR